MLETVEIEPQGEARSAVIWLHGLGADGHDFEPIVPHLNISAATATRFVFPHAPVRAVTVNAGMSMRAWYDIAAADLAQGEDDAGIRDSETRVRELLEREIERGIPSQRIVLAGFSQGGAVALHTGLRVQRSLGGILGLSCYLPLASSVLDERREDNADSPIFMAHGSLDNVVPLQLGHAGFQQLKALDYEVEWHEYRIGHEVSMDEIRTVGRWLQARLSDTAP
jgi:phospholipase/carboxylesterase